MGYFAKRKELKQAAEDRARDESLNNYILNSHASRNNKEAYVPYEVNYGAGEGTNKQPVPVGVMVQLIERTELSTRKFVLNATKGIKIGTDASADIQFTSGDGNPHMCQIFAIDKQVFVRNLQPSSPVYIKRKKQQAFVDDKGIKLISSDMIVVGHIVYTLTIV